MTDPTQGSPKIPADAGVLPYLTVKGGAAAVDFYRRAFGAVEEYRAVAQDGQRLMHSRLAINGGYLLLSDDFPDFRGGQEAPPPAGVTLHLQVDDADAIWNRAVEAGAEVVTPLADQFWGDRYGQLKDPFGHSWSISGPIKAA